MKQILKRLSRYEYVSFDLFDTLVKRNVKNPSDIFTLIELNLKMRAIYLPSDFKEQRIAAERRLRQQLSEQEEITFDQIYEQLISIYDADTILLLKKAELDYELSSCVVNSDIMPIYNACIENGKNVCIISDMYLPKNILESILKKNSIHNYQNIFVSSDIGVTKSSGNLFKYVLSSLDIRPNQLIHIGDNKKSDFWVPLKMGIKSVLITPQNHLNFYNERKLPVTSLFSYKTISSFINNHITKEDSEYWKIGYEALGPLLYGFAAWLLKELKLRNIQKAFFLSRDGYYMQKVFEKINDCGIQTQYLYASRRALIVPLLWMKPDLQNVLTAFFMGKRITVGTFIEKIGLETEKYKNNLSHYDLSPNMVLEVQSMMQNTKFVEFYQSIKSDMVKNSKAEYKLLVDYLNQMNFSGKLAIIDIGWFGNMQRALTLLSKHEKIEIDITGFYIGLVPVKAKVNKDQFLKFGFLFENDKNEDLFQIQNCFNSLFEFFFLGPHGSVKNFQRVENRVEPVLYEYEYEPRENTDYSSEIFLIRELQRGAIEFTDDIIKAHELKNIEIDPYCAFQAIKNLGIYPSLYLTKRFGNIRMLDTGIKYAAKPDQLRKYIFDIKKLKYDFLNSSWRIGFLARLFKIPLPYFRIYMLMRKVLN